jgi:hypothetical protein
VAAWGQRCNRRGNDIHLAHGTASMFPSATGHQRTIALPASGCWLAGLLRSCGLHLRRPLRFPASGCRLPARKQGDGRRQLRGPRVWEDMVVPKAHVRAAHGRQARRRRPAPPYGREARVAWRGAGNLPRPSRVRGPVVAFSTKPVATFSLEWRAPHHRRTLH